MKTIEFMDWLYLSLIGNQLRVSNSFLETWVILSSWKQYQVHLFCVIWILFFILWVRLGYQADNTYSKWGWIRQLHNNLRSAGVQNLFFFVCRNVRLKFILLITFRASDSPDIVSSNMQPKYMPPMNVARVLFSLIPW